MGFFTDPSNLPNHLRSKYGAPEGNQAFQFTVDSTISWYAALAEVEQVTKRMAIEVMQTIDSGYVVIDYSKSPDSWYSASNQYHFNPHEETKPQLFALATLKTLQRLLQEYGYSQGLRAIGVHETVVGQHMLSALASKTYAEKWFGWVPKNSHAMTKAIITYLKNYKEFEWLVSYSIPIPQACLPGLYQEFNSTKMSPLKQDNIALANEKRTYLVLFDTKKQMYGPDSNGCAGFTRKLNGMYNALPEYYKNAGGIDDLL